MGRHDVTSTMAWTAQGTAMLLDLVAALSDAELAGPSALPGWSRAHVVGHLARNAEALGRLARWAATGVETPMYADGEQRAADIERSASLPADVLRRDLARTAAALSRQLDDLDTRSWAAPVRSALGREIPAAEIPWMRAREVWVHALDLGAGAGGAGVEMAAMPAPMIDVLLDDVTGVLGPRPGCPAVVLRATDRDRDWQLVPAPHGAMGGATSAGAVVAGPAAGLAGWVTGRTAGTDLVVDGGLPALPRWL